MTEIFFTDSSENLSLQSKISKALFTLRGRNLKPGYQIFFVHTAAKEIGNPKHFGFVFEESSDREVP